MSTNENNTSAVNPTDSTVVVPPAGTDPAEGLVDTTGDDDAPPFSFTELLAQKFEKAEGDKAESDESRAARAMHATVEDSPQAVDAVQGNLDPEMLKGRVALLSMLLDNSGSMGKTFTVMTPTGYKKITAIRTAGDSHDFVLDTVQRLAGNEPVSVLVTTSLLNNPERSIFGTTQDEEDAAAVVFPYTPINEAPRFNGTPPAIRGMTPLFRRFLQALTATAAMMTTMERYNKTVYGMTGFVTDGQDSENDLEGALRMRDAVLKFRKGNIAVFAMYIGTIHQPGEADYESGRREVLYDLQKLGVDTTELRYEPSVTHEDLLRRYFTALGFAPELIFLPGDNPEAIAESFAAVSQLGVTVSQGKVPESLRRI